MLVDLDAAARIENDAALARPSRSVEAWFRVAMSTNLRIERGRIAALHRFESDLGTVADFTHRSLGAEFEVDALPLFSIR